MQNDRMRRLFITLFLLAVISFNIFYGSTIQPYKTSNNVQKGELYHFSEKKTYWTEITNYCCQDGYLYVLYERKAIMQVFGPDGNYASSYAYYDTNGRGMLGIDDEYAYLEDRNNNWYKFKDGELIEEIPFSDYHSYNEVGNSLYADGLETKVADNGYYYLRWASVFFHNDESGVDKCVIRRPFFFVIYNWAWLLLISFTCLIGAAVMLIISLAAEKRERGQKEFEQWKDGTHVLKQRALEQLSDHSREGTKNNPIVLRPGKDTFSRLIIPLTTMLIGAVIFSVAWHDIIPVLIISLAFFVIMTIRMIMIYYRTIVIDETGITVRFLMLQKTYRWEKIKTKRYVDYSFIDRQPGFEKKNGYRLESQDYQAGALFLPKKMRKRIDMYPELYCEIYHPWSCVFINFTNTSHSDQKSKIEDLSGYVVDEIEFFAQLAEWNVFLDGPTDENS